ncbi:FAD-dependent oxidoreductase [Aspergillus thermomutatus]|uniref:FAD-binding domain-containing protein n=1 Tax=Aspergillus thermomutatus TaxID=41047 RepID=A0A397GMW9_ASPTH|nr:uncharacterized protein CDV56_100627 [Aspergillus thermomutatus]RHZ50373.1 hypothetical protein CDV56_100627 [Aspergillus thermomutatus]
MTHSSHKKKVLIIGAGPGGLVLAHCLRKYDIPFEIFDREKASQPRKQGWAVALIECLSDLEELLPEDIFRKIPTASVNHQTGSLDSFAIINCMTGQQTAMLGGTEYAQPGCLLRVNRQALREVLRQDIDLQNDKEFDHYEESDYGVTAYFKDGTTFTGDIIVGADGAHSAVRKQLFDSPKPMQSKYIPLVGEVQLSKEQYEPLHKIGTAGLFSYGPGLRYLIGLLGTTEDLSEASYYWACCYQSDDPERDSAWVQNASGEELYDRSLEITKSFAPILTDIIRTTKPENMAQPPLRFIEYYLPEVPSTSSRVTLLGDAAHVMIPFHLAGANTAIKDACDLARQLSHPKQDFPEAIQCYEKVMIPRGREKVLRSRLAGELPTLNEILVRNTDNLPLSF